MWFAANFTSRVIACGYSVLPPFAPAWTRPIDRSDSPSATRW
ncbi:MAG TPA: hypothetical protein VHZ33_28810 [Trebonia sp.]|nr:hypothetical protein [Trebonia sp.]